MQPDGARSQLAGLPVLIVEDDAASAKLVAVVLQTEGCVTRIARSAEEALAVIETFSPRVIVLDLILPRMSGLLLAERLKKGPATRDIPIIAVSAFNGPETVRIAESAGCAAYIRKPIDPIALPQLLLSHLGGTP
jgi:two-component system, cell cycle response regulator DivK